MGAQIKVSDSEPSLEVEGKFVYTAVNDKLFKLKRLDGGIDWQKKVHDGVMEFVLTKKAIVAGNTNRAFSYNKGSGDLNWTIKKSGWSYPSPYWHENQLFVANSVKEFYLIGENSGKSKWRFTAKYIADYQNPAFGPEAVFVTTNNSTLNSIDRATGKVIWKKHFKSPASLD